MNATDDPPESTELAAGRFDADPEGVRAARRLVSDAVAQWVGVDVDIDDLELCTSELAANAVLHTRAPYDVVARRVGNGVHVEVIDGRPLQLPAPVPKSGTAEDILSEGMTGHGLQIVAATAARWGYTTSDHHKAVWAELGVPSPHPREPVVVLAAQPTPIGTPVDLLQMPVRAAVASGVQVDDLVRDLQLSDGHGGRVDLAALYQVLDATAGPRLAGRYAALDAAARGATQFDLRIHMTPGIGAAFRSLNEMLNGLDHSRVASTRITPEVGTFRSWVGAEVARQLGGEKPLPYPA